MGPNYVVRTLLLSCTFILCLLIAACSQKEKQAGTGEPSPDQFTGRWSLYLPGGAGYLKVYGSEGSMDAELLWYGGSVLPVDSLYLTDTGLVVTMVSPVNERNEAGEVVPTRYITNHFDFKLVSPDELEGKAVFPRRDGTGENVTEFTAKRSPDLPERPDLSAISYGEPVKLFNGKDLTGWELTDPERKNGFSVVDGVLVNNPVDEEGGHGGFGNLRTVDEFGDFKLNIEVNVPEGSNSGIYLRGIYEVQVLDSYGQELDSHNMGAIYSRITPSVAAEKPAGEWQTLEIILCQRHATVVLNDTTIIDNRPIEGVTGGALTADEFVPGPIYLQGDHGKVSYRNIILTPIIE
jgi:hypothetical protein